MGKKTAKKAAALAMKKKAAALAMKKKAAALAIADEEQHFSAAEMVQLAKQLLALTPPPHFLSDDGSAVRRLLDSAIFHVVTEERLLGAVDELVGAKYGGGIARSPTVGIGLALSLLALSTAEDGIRFQDDFELRCLKGRACKEEALKAFFTALQSNSKVKWLELAGAAFATEEVAAQLAHYLNVTSTLQELTVYDSCGFFQDEEAKVWGAFSDTLQSNSSLHTLTLVGDCEFGAHMVATFIRFSGLSHISLDELPMSPGVCELLPALLSPGNSPTLTHLAMVFSFGSRLCNEVLTREFIGRMADALLLNTTLTGLKVDCLTGTSFWPESVCAGFAAMLHANCTLKVLKLGRTDVRFNEGVGHALSQNRSLEKVEIALDVDGANALFRSLSGSNSSGGPNGGPPLHTLHLVNAVGDAQALAHMLATNNTLHKLKLDEASYSKEDWALHILPALASNITLQTLGLEGCHGVDEQLVYQALIDLLWINMSIRKINLQRTPLKEAGKAEAVEAAVGRNVEYTAALKNMPTMPPKSCRLVLCGYPYAGKTTLVETMQRSLQNKQDDGTLNQCGIKEEEKPRTRRCDIATLVDEASLRICAWDLAGHQHYYALHNCIFPTVTNGTSVFLFAFNPLDNLNSSRKRDVIFKEELEYWLRFIASNSHQFQLGVKPIVIVVVTHQDQPKARMNKFQVGLIVRTLAQTFEKIINVHTTPFLVDAFSQDDIKSIWDTIELLLRELVQQVPQVPIICEQFRIDIEKWSSQNGHSPVITSNECRALFQTMDVGALYCQEDTYFETFIAQEKSWDVVMAYLHDVGAILYFKDIDFVVVNPHWLAHGILGYLVNPSLSTSLQPDYEPAFQPHNGLVDIVTLQKLLEESLDQMGLNTSLVSTERFIELLLRMNLCYEQVYIDDGGNRHRKFLIPSLLSKDIGDLHTGQKGVSAWTPMAIKKESCRFVGHRLQCQDTTCTFFTTGFFPRLQVEMYNWCLKEGWITQDQMDTTQSLRANVFEISVHGHDLKIEHSGDAGYFVDILVRSFKSYSKALNFVQNQVIARIRRFFATQKGCVGVMLEEHLIRRECVQMLTLCKYRKKQSILWANLRDQIRDNDERIYIQQWQAVTHETQGSTLILDANLEYAALVKDDNNKNDIIILGESVDDVLSPLGIPSWVVEEEGCYPNTSVRKGKRRGLAFVISMEADRPGGAVDRERLETLARTAQFELDVPMVDKTAAGIRAHVKQLAADPALKEDDCFLCCINGHCGTIRGEQVIEVKNEDGDEDGGIIYLVRDIFQPFQKSKHLAGKPKVFFINASRGDLTHPVSPPTSSPSSSTSVAVHQPSGEDEYYTFLDGLSDWLIVLSTTENYVSWREHIKGSTFVKALVEALAEHRHTADVLTILNDVTRDIEIGKDGSGTRKTFLQSPLVQRTLRKKLYWGHVERSGVMLGQSLEEGSSAPMISRPEVKGDQVHPVPTEDVRHPISEFGSICSSICSSSTLPSSLPLMVEQMDQTVSLRPDVVDLGYTSFNDVFESGRILALRKVQDGPHGGQVRVAFMHPEGMAQIIGVGLPHAILIRRDEDPMQIEVEEVTEHEWRRLWTDPTNEELFSPVLVNPPVHHPSANVKLSREESLQRFGLGVEGSEVVVVTCPDNCHGGSVSNAGQAMDVDQDMSSGQDKPVVLLNGGTNSLQTSSFANNDSCLANNGQERRQLPAVEKSLTIRVLLLSDASIEPPVPPNPDADASQLKKCKMGTKMIIKFFDLPEKIPPMTIEVKVEAEYGLKTLATMRRECYDSYGWYHDELRSSFKASDKNEKNAIELVDKKPWCLGEDNSTPGMVTSQTQKAKGWNAKATFGISGNTAGGDISRSSNDSKQFACTSRFKSDSIGSPGKVAFLTQVHPPINKERLLSGCEEERGRAQEAKMVSSMETTIWSRWHVLKHTKPHYSYRLVVSRNFYMLKKREKKDSQGKKYEIKEAKQVVKRTFLVNHSFSHLLTTTENVHTWLLQSDSSPQQAVKQVIDTQRTS